jgi:protein-tyrosine phosphatase
MPFPLADCVMRCGEVAANNPDRRAQSPAQIRAIEQKSSIFSVALFLLYAAAMHGRGHHQLAVLFVCLGNICRSPMAEGAFRAAAARHGLECDVDSAGTATYHLGNPPDPRAIATARRNGVDISAQIARQIAREDFYRFTHIIAMDEANLAGIRSQAPRDATASIAMLMDALAGSEGSAVPDPYHGDDAMFAAVWEQIATAADALAARFATEGIAVRL